MLKNSFGGSAYPDYHTVPSLVCTLNVIFCLGLGLGLGLFGGSAQSDYYTVPPLVCALNVILAAQPASLNTRFEMEPQLMMTNT